MFAPASTQTWRSFLKMLAQEQNWQLLKMAQNMRPKEYDAMSPELEKIFEQLEAEEPERYSQDWFEVIQHRFPMLKPTQKAQLLADLTPEQKSQALAELTSEEKLEWLKILQKELGQG
jgi:hypothetical protein